jgi:hypothetical protein
MTITYDKQVLIKRGNTSSVSTYVGPLGELVLDTDTNLVYVHDGVTVGGTVVGGGEGDASNYSNLNVAAYLPGDATITSLVANAGAQSAAISTLAANAAAQAGQITSLNTSITTANTNMKGYVDAANTIQSNQIASVNTSITTANTNMKGYVDASISANINAIIGGAASALDTLNELANALGNDASFSTSVTNSLTALTSNAAVQAGLIANLQVGAYSNANVASYLPTYSGNIKVNNITFNDLSEQRTAYTGQSWRTLLESSLLAKPDWLAYVPDGSKPTVGVNFGFDSSGMWFTGNANDQHAYPIRTNVGFYDTDAVEVITTFDFDHISDDHGIAIFNSATTQPYWRFGTDSTRIAYQFSTGIPQLYGRTTSDVAGASILTVGETYTIRMVYDPLADADKVTVELYQGAGITGTLLDTRSINEQLPAGAYLVGFDADQDNLSLKSYFTDLTIKTLTNAVFNDIEVVGSATFGNILPSANVTYSLGSATHQWKDLWVSGNTIHIGGSTIGQANGAIAFSVAPGVDIGLRNVTGWQDYANNVDIAIGQPYTIDSTMGTWGDLSNPGPGPYLDGAFPGIRYAFGVEPVVPAQWTFTYDVNGFVDTITLVSAGDPIQFDDQFEFVWFPDPLATVTLVFLGEASTDPIDTTDTIWNADGKELYINRDAFTNIVSVTGTGWTGADVIPGGLDGRFAVLKLPDDSVVFDGIDGPSIGVVEDCFALSYFIVTTETSYAPVAIATSTPIYNTVTTDNIYIGNLTLNAPDGNLVIDGSLIPSANVTYSLGDATHQWKDLWVSNNTIYINSIPLSMAEDNTLLVNNVPVVTYVNGSLSVGGNVVSGGGDATVVRQDTAPTADNGILWFNTQEARMYIKYNEQWVDSSPTVLTPPETNPTFESVTFNDATVQTTAWTGTVSYRNITEVPEPFTMPTFVGGGGASTWLTAD